MRYRAFGQTGRSISALTLRLPQGLEGRDGVALIYAALESGINAFELCNPSAEACRALGEALATIERRMAIVILRIGGGEARGGERGVRDFSRDAIVHAVEGALAQGGFGRLDAVLLDAPQPEETRPDTLPALLALREAGRAVLIGLSGEGPLVEAALSGPAAEGEGLDILGATYNLRSGWPQRNRIKRAIERGMTVLGERFQPDPARIDGPAETSAPSVARTLLGLGRRSPAALEKTQAYDFLGRTPGWKADEICLAYVMTEPTVSTVLVEANDAEDVARLAVIPERELPTGLPAQIEMARFGEGA